MSKRQQSFFDQDQKTRNFRPQNSKVHNAASTSNQLHKAAPNVTPIAASSQSRSRLRVFRYRQIESAMANGHGVEQHADSNKENAPQAGTQKTPLQMNPPLQPSSQRSAGKEARDCPQTPIGRLPLSELLASDEARQPAAQTPMERVLWENSPSNADAAGAKPLKKKRKRAVSTSPSSSSQSERPGHFPTIDAAKAFRQSQEIMKTPKADPVDDLWSRYSLHTRDKLSPSAPSAFPFPMLRSSSPHTPVAQLQRDSGLRRALSCIEWPTSAAKRRKLHHSTGERKTAAAFVEERDSVGKAKLSRVSFLVEKMHSGLSKGGKDIDCSSSEPVYSSPMRQKSKSPTRERSPPHHMRKAIENVANVLSQTVMNGNATKIAIKPVLSEVERPNFKKVTNSSDFGDDGIDDEMFEVESASSLRNSVDANRKVAQEDLLSDAVYEEDWLDEETRCLSENKVAKSENDVSKGGSPRGDEFEQDDFDEDDVEGFAADLEGVFAKYDTQPSTGASTAREETPPSYTVPAIATAAQNPTEAVEICSSDDEDFGNDSDFEQIASECAKASQNQSINVSSQSNIIALRQSWLDSQCSPGSIVHVIGDFDRHGQCIIDNTRNLLIMHPDHLISSTVVGDSFTCIRKAVLQDRVKTTGGTSQATVYGHLLHEIFQEALRANQWDDQYMTALIQKIATRNLETLFEINVEVAVAIDQLKARATTLQAWSEIFVSAKPNPKALVKDRNGREALMSINKLLEAEEHVWAPAYGLKGNIDATVQICLEEDGNRRTLTVPFELKTGKHSSAAHKAQTALYSLLLSDRYDIEVACGILYYMQSSEISSIRTIRHELVPMIIQRNAIANYVRNRLELPKMLRNPYTCGKCYAQTPCFTYHKLVDNGTGESSGLGVKFDDEVRHLNTEHSQFFRRWDDLLTKEERDIVILRRELWTMQSTEREKVGRCFGRLVIEPGSYHEESETSKINRFRYNLIKQSPLPGFKFTDSQITVGEPIVISDERGHFALANGYVKSVRTSKIQVTVDRQLHNARARSKDFDAETNQVFSGVMEMVEHRNRKVTQSPPQPEGPVLYRLDKDEFSNGMAMIRNNLLRLMEKDLFGVQALRRLIVEGAAPTFNPVPTNLCLGETANEASLNVDQRGAIEKVMSAKDYALVLGMPGTGKTTTIAHIIRALVARGKSVLLTSYTHTAVDNILLKLRKDNVGIFRLGAIAKVHPEIQEFADLAGRPMNTIEEIKRCYTQRVVATTCLGINHPIFNQRIFDYCIVDEASQITLPVCLGPIRMARTFILVGDHYQLPPLVQNKEALEGGLDVSLFKILSDMHPSSVVNLEHQYRMCEDIMALSNKLIYDGRLKCGTQSVAVRSLQIPNIQALESHHHTLESVRAQRVKHFCASSSPGRCWIRDLLEPRVKACFVNTDLLLPQSHEVLESGSRITNPCEVTLAVQIAESLLTSGIAAGDIGVITLYRSQLALLKQAMRHRPGVEMHTADRFQGRDKEVVILSLVRSNEQQVVGDLLKDWRRVNVALTRARTKLLVLGSKRTLVGNQLLKDFIELMQSREWWYDLPQKACEGHIFEEAGTQISGEVGFEADRQTNRSAAATAQQALTSALRLGKGDQIGKKSPAKQAKIDLERLINKRPVLRDIVNDAS
ncbi:uncharacterized protein KY384_002032 [Bacidia gigantensis]|uniref:uncharacterized protein n=1 Tax=Bacidia gigantensis TaxID=2732470 RepID=UPI001D046912|nr:uncharacterized protein KY384_002032 [Bacidia gigantensis]KAG8533249.1 hypothetical protein KY384_002032 [Bacidia gigantensis]